MQLYIAIYVYMVSTDHSQTVFSQLRIITENKSSKEVIALRDDKETRHIGAETLPRFSQKPQWRFGKET